jgi:SAM-dependent methyltransferase
VTGDRWWSAYASLYDRLWGTPLTDELAALVIAQVGPGPVLDAGAGTGLLWTSLAGRGPVVGLDRCPSMLAAAAHRPGWRVAGDVRQPPFRPGSFGTVVATNLLHLAGPPAPVLDGLVPLLKPASRLVLCWPRDGTGGWRVLRAERRRGATRRSAAGRLALRVLVGLVAALPGAPRRVGETEILTAIATTARRSGFRLRHDIVLDRLQHLVVLDRPAAD